MRRVLFAVGVLTWMACCASTVSAANILDLIYRGATAGTNAAVPTDAAIPNAEVSAQETKEADQEHQDEAQTAETSAEEKTCACNGRECMCCVDFNMTFIDLGTGCVRMKYISQTEGVRLNVSYGDNLLRSGVSHGPRPAATCVSMIGQLAAVCARFTSLQPHADGLQGCLKLEPKLLGDVQTSLNIGCFTMNDEDGMRMDDDAAATNQEQEQEQEQESEATTVTPDADAAAAAAATNQTSAESNLNEDEILAVVNESAQKGLAFFQNWLGIDFSSTANGTTTEDGEDSTAAKPAEDSTNA